MSLVYSPDLADVNATSYTSAVLTVGTSAVELFTGGSRNPRRQALLIYNDSSATVFLGPSTVTISGSTKGVPLLPSQSTAYPAGDLAVYAIAGSASNAVLVQELA